MTLQNRFKFLLEVKEVLDKVGVEFWIDFGTLLGFYRQGDFLETDPDIDIGVKVECRNTVVYVVSEFLKIGKVVPRLEDGILAGYKIYKDDTWIDIAFFFPCGDKYLWPISQWPKVMTYDKKFFDNLVDIEVKGVKFKMPRDIEEYMVLHYGENWRVPFVAGQEYDLHACLNVESNEQYKQCLK